MLIFRSCNVKAQTYRGRYHVNKRKGRNETMNRKFLEKLGLEKETIDSIMAEHGKAIQAIKPADDYEDLQNTNAALEKQLTNLQTTLESKETELDSLEELKKEIASHKLDKLKTNIAIQANIPLELAGRLSGENEEELKVDAEKMAGFVNKKNPLPLKQTEPPVDDKDAGLKKMLNNMNTQ